MPEWPIYLVLAALLTGILCWVVAGFLLAVCSVRGLVRLVRRLTRPGPAIEEEPDSEASAPYIWRACHSPRCAHLQTLHLLRYGQAQCTSCGTVTGL